MSRRETYESKLRELTSGRDSRVLSQDKTIVGTKLLLEMFLPEDWTNRHTGDEIHGVVLSGTKYMWFAVICSIDPAKAKAIAVRSPQDPLEPRIRRKSNGGR